MPRVHTFIHQLPIIFEGRNCCREIRMVIIMSRSLSPESAALVALLEAQSRSAGLLGSSSSTNSSWSAHPPYPVPRAVGHKPISWPQTYPVNTHNPSEQFRKPSWLVSPPRSYALWDYLARRRGCAQGLVGPAVYLAKQVWPTQPSKIIPLLPRQQFSFPSQFWISPA
jgi:hypothetical protein